MDLFDPATPVVATAETMTLDDLRSSLVEAAAAISAAQARLAQAMAAFRARSGDQAGSGFTSFGQWASVNLGMSSRAASDLADAGQALGDRTEVRKAWEAGGLSTSKAKCVLGVATEASESSWCALAKEASATQLARIAAAYRRSERDGEDTAGRDAEDHEATCGVWWRTRDDGLSELLAILTPDDAAVVRAALESETETQWRADRSPQDSGGRDDDTDGVEDDVSSASAGGEDETDVPGRTNDDAGEDQRGEATSPAPRPTAVRRLDALVGVAANRLAAGTVPIVRGERTEVVLHVDEQFLRGDTDAGLCNVTNGPDLSLADARRLACDARIRGLVRGADGSTVDLGRSQRLVSDKLRRLLTARDHGCRFPGCTHTRYVDAHHVVHWEDGGSTDMANLVLLCNRHHRLLHHGSFTIDANGGRFAFLDRFSHLIRPPDIPVRHRCRNAPENPRARSGGDPRYSIDLAVAAMASAG